MQNFMKNKSTKKKEGITLIALVITVIVLLILAAISITMLMGDNSILKRAVDAKNETEKGQEKEIIKLAYNSALAKKLGNGYSATVTGSELNDELNSLEASATGDNPIIVRFEKSGRAYTIDNRGNVKEKQIGTIGLKLNVVKKDEQTYILEVYVEGIPTEEEWLKEYRKEHETEFNEMFAKSYRGANATYAGISGNGNVTVDYLYDYSPGKSGIYNNIYDFIIKQGYSNTDAYNEKYKKTELSLNNETITVASKGEFNITKDGIYKVTAINDEGDKGEATENIIVGEKFTDIYQETAKYTDSNGDTAYIPKGFAVGKGYFINKIENGLVITDHVDENGNSDGNEFVWIPVENAIWDGTSQLICTKDYYVKLNGQTPSDKDCYTIIDGQTPLAKLKSGSTSNYEGMFYEYGCSILGNSVRPHEYLKNVTSATYSKVEEPAITTYDIKDFSSYNIRENTLQEEFNKMIKSVDKYKGFYVARFELGFENKTIPVSKSVAKNNSVRTADADYENSKTWYGLYQKCKEMYDDESEDSTYGVKSNMIWGSQYDAILNWGLKRRKNHI